MMIMNKYLFALLLVPILLVGVSAAFASSDVDAVSVDDCNEPVLDADHVATYHVITYNDSVCPSTDGNHIDNDSDFAGRQAFDDNSAHLAMSDDCKDDSGFSDKAPIIHYNPILIGDDDNFPVYAPIDISTVDYRPSSEIFAPVFPDHKVLFPVPVNFFPYYPISGESNLEVTPNIMDESLCAFSTYSQDFGFDILIVEGSGLFGSQPQYVDVADLPAIGYHSGVLSKILADSIHSIF